MGNTHRLILFLCLFHLGCGAGSELTRLPQRQIDRPLTLPDEVHAWQPISVGVIREARRSGWNDDLLVGGVLSWTQSVTDRVDVQWSPIPLALSYRLVDSDRAKAAVIGGTGLLYQSGSGLEFLPVVNVTGRVLLSRSVSLDAAAAASASVQPGWDDGIHYASGLQLGSLVQLTDTLALMGGASLVSADTGAKIVPFDVVSSFDEHDHLGSTALPLYFGLAWSLHEQWELNPFYQYYSIGYEDDFTSHLFGVTLQHFFVWDPGTRRPDGIGY